MELGDREAGTLAVPNAAAAEEGDAATRQLPAVAATVEASPQQVQEVQPPGASSAEAEQQQPPRQRLLPQSKGVEQGSPGEESAQEPVKGEQEEQLARAAVREQQKPALQREGALQEEEEVQAEPGRAGRGEVAPPGQREGRAQGLP